MLREVASNRLVVGGRWLVVGLWALLFGSVSQAGFRTKQASVEGGPP